MLRRRSREVLGELANRLGFSRDALRQTLDALIEADLVMRNPGHGHPARPEYVLTEHGQRVAPFGADLLRELGRRGIAPDGVRKWWLPILATLTAERRYGELRRSVGATPRALTLALKQLVGLGLVERTVHDGFPPSTSYRLTAESHVLCGQVTRLAAEL